MKKYLLSCLLFAFFNLQVFGDSTDDCINIRLKEAKMPKQFSTTPNGASCGNFGDSKSLPVTYTADNGFIITSFKVHEHNKTRGASHDEGSLSADSTVVTVNTNCHSGALSDRGEFTQVIITGTIQRQLSQSDERRIYRECSSAP